MTTVNVYCPNPDCVHVHGFVYTAELLDGTVACPKCGGPLSVYPKCTDCGQELDPRGYFANVSGDEIDPYCEECLYKIVFEGSDRWRKPKPTVTPSA